MDEKEWEQILPFFHAKAVEAYANERGLNWERAIREAIAPLVDRRIQELDGPDRWFALFGRLHLRRATSLQLLSFLGQWGRCYFDILEEAIAVRVATHATGVVPDDVRRFAILKSRSTPSNAATVTGNSHDPNVEVGWAGEYWVDF
jgi:hypothetical protein